MRHKPAGLDSPLLYAAVGASILAIPASAAAVSDSPAQSGSAGAIKAGVKRRKIKYHHEVVVVGQAPSSDRGQTIALQFSRRGTGAWQQLDSARIGSDGSFRLAASLRRSGWVRATLLAPSATASSTLLTAADSSTSTPLRVAVAAALHVRPRTINDLGGRTFSLRGRLVPDRPGRLVLLQGDHSGRWVTLSWARNSLRGTFALRYRPHGTGRERLRVVFAGDRANAAAYSPAGSLTVYRQAVASWYYDGGSTACGFHAYHGVANVSLPCGTKVGFSYRGRTVEAVVDDRGPYVAGRTWDLNQNTASALGLVGVSTVWASR
jgi:hypothetical protein